jgi:hypothetical protein
MGYFSNGTEGMDYEARYCQRCVHYGPDEGPGCPVWLLHLVHNYDGANDPGSFLHTLIPLSKDGLSNEQCKMFIPRQPGED